MIVRSAELQQEWKREAKKVGQMHYRPICIPSLPSKGQPNKGLFTHNLIPLHPPSTMLCSSAMLWPCPSSSPTFRYPLGLLDDKKV
jgi:hypothetical protein